jgi:hypothetical protein
MSLQMLLHGFLLRNGYCPLPGIGCVRLQTTSALLQDAGSTIKAPQHQLVLEREIESMDALLSHLSHGLLLSKTEAEQSLQRFCNDIKLDAKIASSLFSAFGNWSFERNKFQFQSESWHHAHQHGGLPVPLATHSDASHLIRVGESERSSDEMQQALQQSTSSKRHLKKLGVWLLLAGILVVLAYLFTSGLFNADLGFQQTIPVQKPPSTYQTIQ